VAALLGTAILCLAFGDIALAQDAAPPACGGKVLEKCTPNSGDTAWMLTSVALVLMMTIPGLGLFYGGMVPRERCWKYDWVLEFDIKGLFDNIDHELLLRAVRKHVTCKWAL
jgi:hypothetical protein